MDKLPGLTLVVCLIGLLAAPLARAQEPPFTAVVTGDDVNVRSGASTNYYPVGQLDRGDLVRVREFLYGWAVIDPPPGTFSYISADFVELAADNETGTVTGDGVRVRAPSPRGPSKGYSYKIQMQLDEGATVKVLEEEDGWYRIVPPENAALYVHRDFIRPATPDEIAAAQAPESEPEADAAEPAAAEAEAETVTEPVTPRTPEQVMAEAVAPSPAESEPAPAEPMQEAEVAVQDPPPAITEPTAEAAPEAAEPADEPVVAEAATTPESPDAPDAPTTPAGPTAEAEAEPAPDAPAPAEAETAAATAEAEAEAAAETDAERRRAADEALAALEVRFSRISTRPLPRQPIDELLDEYRRLADSPHLAPESEVLVDTRVELLETRQQLKQALTDLRMVEEEEEPEPAREPAKQYTAVGRLMASTVYTGERMPLLYRLVDPLSGLTVAYVRPEPRQNLTDLLGQYVGVIGQSRYDTGLKLNIIEVQEADELAAQPGRS